MSDATQKALDRLLKRMDRPPRRGFSLAPIYLTLGLVLAYQLLTRFVPLVWSSLLPQGSAQAEQLRGWPGLAWRMGIVCRTHSGEAIAILVIAGVIGFVLSRGPRPLRVLVWLAAIGVVVIDILILVLTLKTSLGAVLEDSGL